MKKFIFISLLCFCFIGSIFSQTESPFNFVEEIEINMHKKDTNLVKIVVHLSDLDKNIYAVLIQSLDKKDSIISITAQRIFVENDVTKSYNAFVVRENVENIDIINSKVPYCYTLSKSDKYKNSYKIMYYSKKEFCKIEVIVYHNDKSNEYYKEFELNNCK
ncbi:hypothetical protein [Hugenholtzia roseola]|uniref:hypothetical protein n=1 Tax=Hugenholtzia roseola TaxID=1002 RepID=UPI00047C3E8D|nr:hypothetical protein [Hugenholtzia roseola]